MLSLFNDNDRVPKLFWSISRCLSGLIVGEFDTLRIENRIPAGFGKRLRTWLLAFLLAPVPLLVIGWLAASEGDAPWLPTFLVSTLVLVAWVFVPPSMRFSRYDEIDSRGITFRTRGTSTRIPWQSLRSVRVVASRDVAPPRITFLLWSMHGGRKLTVDVSQGLEVANRVASAIARYAPDVQRKCAADNLHWDPAGPTDGDFAYQDPSLGHPGIVFAPAAALSCLLIESTLVLGVEIVPLDGLRGVAGVAYFILVSIYAVAAHWMISREARAEPRRISPRGEAVGRFAVAAMIGSSALGAIVLMT